MQQNDCGTATPTGWRCSTADRMLCIRGKQKTAGRKFTFSPALFHVFSTPVGLVSFVPFGAIRWQTFLRCSRFCRPFPFRAEMRSFFHTTASPAGCREELPAAGVQGTSSPLLRFWVTGGNCSLVHTTTSPAGSRGETPGCSVLTVSGGKCLFVRITTSPTVCRDNVPDLLRSHPFSSSPRHPSPGHRLPGHCGAPWPILPHSRWYAVF